MISDVGSSVTDAESWLYHNQLYSTLLIAALDPVSASVYIAFAAVCLHADTTHQPLLFNTECRIFVDRACAHELQLQTAT